MARLRTVDLTGTVLLIGFFLTLLMGINFGGLVYEWNSGSIIALFVLAGVLFVMFSLQQTFAVLTTKQTRAFPIHFWKSFDLTNVFIQECCSSTINFIPTFFIPLYFQFVDQNDALGAGVRLLPFMVSLVIAIVVNGFVVGKTGRHMPWFLGGGILALIGSALMYTTHLGTPDANIYGYSVLLGLGSGCFLQLPYSVVQSLVPPDQIPQAISFVTVAQLAFPSIMMSLVNAVFLNEASNNIQAAFSSIPRETVISILSGVGSDTFHGLPADRQQVILGFIVEGLNKGYIVCMAMASLAVVLSIFLPRGKMFE